jgi:formate dehydrogenase gamma subunit
MARGSEPAGDRSLRIALVAWLGLLALAAPCAVPAVAAQADAPQAATGGSPAAEAPAFTDEDCLACHDPASGPWGAIADSLGAGVHSGFGCRDCHAGILELPHPEELPRPDCAACHPDVVELYRQHGKGQVGQSAYIPECGNCHGAHRILAAGDERSPLNPLRLPATCGRCHEDSTLISKLSIKFKHPIRVYSRSVHGRATAGGMQQAATCNDCHATDADAHMILPPGDSRSTINHFNIPYTCGRCHNGIEQEYWEGIHGQLTADGETDAPTCTHCHGEHGILPVDDPRSPVSPYRLAEATCAPCHESAALNEKYDLPTGRLRTFIDSYHGLKSQAGDRTVANCASCHGPHRILPASDPASSIHPDNLVRTCGHCHPNISASIAKTPIHARSAGLYSGWPRFFQILYSLAIAVIIGAMTLHWLIDLFRQIRNVMRERQVRRMDADEVWQHTLLALAFTVLVITGFSLRFHNAWWSTLLFGHEGGYSLRGVIHRVAGVLLLAGALWHLFFLMTRRGRVFLRDMWPRRADFSGFMQMIRYNLGATPEHPLMGRFTYVEKAEYWALVWGTAVMGITGLFLWFDNFVVRLFSKGLLEVFLVIHYYEAWLAFLAILIWHFYATIFSPRVYPMNPSWLTGSMPERMFRAEHEAAHAASNVAEADWAEGEGRIEGAGPGGTDAESPGVPSGGRGERVQPGEDPGLDA